MKEDVQPKKRSEKIIISISGETSEWLELYCKTDGILRKDFVSLPLDYFEHTGFDLQSWAGTICSDPAMVSISVRKERFSHSIIRDTGEFVINLVNKRLVRATDYCGVKSGRDVDKFKETRLTPQASRYVKAPGVEESPVNIECKVVEVKELGSHDMFIAKVMGVTIDNQYMDDRGKFNLNASGLVSYSHGEYFELGKKLGSFGYSVKKPVKRQSDKKRTARRKKA